jgi:tetratricopeptide (TPR) repeat protein
MKMLSIFAITDKIAEITDFINSEYRLNELVEIKDFLKQKPEPSGHALVVNSKGIAHPIDWYNVSPPYILPERIPLSKNTLLGLVFAKLGNYEKAYSYLADEKFLLKKIDTINRLQNGYPTDPSVLTIENDFFEEYRFVHNHAILRHYGASEEAVDVEKMRYFYHEALQCAPNDEYRAFSAKHYASLLLDLDDLAQAEDLLLKAIKYALSDDAKAELKAVLCSVWMKKLVIPYDQTLLTNLKEMIWDVMKYYESKERQVEVGLLLIDASHIANIADSFSESLGYISRAVSIFDAEELPELLANAQYRKGTLLYTWAKNGNSQFFRSALDSYQAALRVFTREATPSVFAEIHHHLGVIYSEIPDEIRKKSIWAAVSSSSFQEALGFYNKENYPYEYAMICNNYGNALTKYPDALHSDNYEKAIFYYQEALNIRTANAYPYERAVTLLNFIEGCWYINNGTDDFNEARFDDMVNKAKEVKTLVEDAKLIEEADGHLAKLAALRNAYTTIEMD